MFLDNGLVVGKYWFSLIIGFLFFRENYIILYINIFIKIFSCWEISESEGNNFFFEKLEYNGKNMFYKDKNVRF